MKNKKIDNRKDNGGARVGVGRAGIDEKKKKKTVGFSV